MFVLEIVQHMLANIISSPYSFKNYSIVRPGTSRDPFGVSYMKDDNSGVWAEALMCHAGYKYVLRIKPNPEYPRWSCYTISLLDPDTYDVVCEHNVETSGMMMMDYTGFNNISFAMMNIIHRLLAEHFDVPGVVRKKESESK